MESETYKIVKQAPPEDSEGVIEKTLNRVAKAIQSLWFLAGLVVGGTVWLTTLQLQLNQSMKDQARVEAKQDKMDDTLRETQRDMASLKATSAAVKEDVAWIRDNLAKRP